MFHVEHCRVSLRGSKRREPTSAAPPPRRRTRRSDVIPQPDNPRRATAHRRNSTIPFVRPPAPKRHPTQTRRAAAANSPHNASPRTPNPRLSTERTLFTKRLLTPLLPPEARVARLPWHESPASRGTSRPPPVARVARRLRRETRVCRCPTRPRHGSRRRDPCHDERRRKARHSSGGSQSITLSIPSYHRADDHVHSSGRSTSPRRHGFSWM